MRRLSSAIVISSLHNRIHTPDMETAFKGAVWLPCGRVIKNDPTRNPLLSPCEMHLSVYNCPLSLWDAFVSPSHPMGCICQCTIVLSLCGMHLSVYYCPLTLWDAFVSVQLSSHPVGCICQCTIVLSLCGMHLSVYYCIHMVTPRVFSCGTQQQQQQQQQQQEASSQPLCCL